MFESNQGFGLGKWLYWFIGFMAAYAALTMFPDNKVAVVIAGLFAAMGIALARHQIRNRNR